MGASERSRVFLWIVVIVIFDGVFEFEGGN
jgi:hypothetical protein